MKRGTLQSFDAGSYTASVLITGSTGVLLTAVAVARNIASGEMTPGRSVAIQFFDIANPSDGVLLAVWT